STSDPTLRRTRGAGRTLPEVWGSPPSFPPLSILLVRPSSAHAPGHPYSVYGTESIEWKCTAQTKAAWSGLCLGSCALLLGCFGVNDEALVVLLLGAVERAAAGDQVQ